VERGSGCYYCQGRADAASALGSVGLSTPNTYTLLQLLPQFTSMSISISIGSVFK